MSKRPNIVFVMTDDQGPWALGCAGTPELMTPVLDGIAGEGIRFTNFYCASPVCSPARASLLTGMIPSRHGVLDWIRGGSMADDSAQYHTPDYADAGEPIEYLEGIRGYTDYLADSGYVCGLSGKWHLGHSVKKQKSFTFWYAHQRGGGRYYGAPMIRDGVPYLEDRYVTDAITDEALHFLDIHGGGERPFYLSVHYTAPHSPWIDSHPPELIALYDDCDFPSIPRIPLRDRCRIPLVPETHEWRESLKGYFASITAVDRSVGRIMEKLRHIGAYDHTLFIFTSDNGFNCGHHGIWGKGNGTFPINMLEESVKVPAIFWQPGKVPRGVCEDCVSGYDFLPTLLDYLGIPEPMDDRLPGKSFAPLLRGEKHRDDRPVIIYDEYGPVRMIRQGDWKYVHRYPYGPHELYNLREDPAEERNLYEDTDQRKRAAVMHGTMKDWFIRYADPCRDGLHEAVTGSGQINRVGNGGEIPWLPLKK